MLSYCFMKNIIFTFVVLTTGKPRYWSNKNEMEIIDRDLNIMRKARHGSLHLI